MRCHFGLPAEICAAQPTTDTYSLAQDFTLRLPYAKMDLALWAYNHDVAPAELARFLGISEIEAHHVYTDIKEAKHHALSAHAAGSGRASGNSITDDGEERRFARGGADGRAPYENKSDHKIHAPRAVAYGLSA